MVLPGVLNMGGGKGPAGPRYSVAGGIGIDCHRCVWSETIKLPPCVIEIDPADLFSRRVRA